MKAMTTYPLKPGLPLDYASPMTIAKTVFPKAITCGGVGNTQIPPPLRLIFNMLCRTLYPSGDHTKLSIAQQYIIYHIATHRKINLHGLMFRRFSAMTTKLYDPKDSSVIRLPYCMWVSKVLKAKGVLLSTSVGYVNCYDVMSDGQFGKMLIRIGDDGLHPIKSRGKGLESASSSKGSGPSLEMVLKAVQELGAWVKADSEKKDVAMARVEDALAGIGRLEKVVDGLKGEVDVISTLLQAKEDGPSEGNSDDESSS